MGQINTNNYPTVDSLADTDLLIVENAQNGTGTTTPKQLRENAIGTDPLQTTAQTVTGAINELKNSSGGDSYALVGMGQVTSYSNKLANTNVYLHRAPQDGDRLFIWFPMEVTDSDAQVKIYDEASGTAYTLAFSFWASGWKLYGLCLLGIADDGLGNLGLSLIYNFEGGTNYTAGTGIEINGSAISNTAPNYGVDVDGATISSVSSGNLGTYVGESKYLILYFSASASPYSGGYTLTLSYSGSVAIQAYGTLYDGSSRYNSNISAGTMLLCEVTDTGTGSSADPVHVNIIGKIDPNSGGSGNTISKTRYTITASSWSSSQDVSGLYTYTLALNPTLVGSVNVYVAGSYDYIAPTDANKTNYSYVKRCNLNTSNLILRAYPKPDANFYIWVEGVEGTNGSGTSYETAGNVIQPNGESSGGGSRYSTSETLTGDTWKGSPVYSKIFSFTLNTIPEGSTEVLTSYATDIQTHDIVKVSGEILFYSGGVQYCENAPNRNIAITASGKYNMGSGDRLGLYIRHYTTDYNGATLNVLVEYTKS